jgi:hypothetical protein
MTARPINNRVTEMTGTDYPIIQAPMGWIARAQLAAAVTIRRYHKTSWMPLMRNWHKYLRILQLTMLVECSIY